MLTARRGVCLIYFYFVLFYLFFVFVLNIEKIKKRSVLIGFLIGQLSRFIRYFSPQKIEGFSVLKLKIAQKRGGKVGKENFYFSFFFGK